MEKKPEKHHVFLAASLGFWLTVFIVRGIIFTALDENRTPAIFLDGIHLHHFFFGFIILMLALAGLSWDRRLLYFYYLVMGVGLGLITDEFLYWTRFDFDYWSLANLFAIFGVGSILLVSYWIENVKASSNLKPVPAPDKPFENPLSPKVSVVIPAFNEETYISHCLNSLTKQSFRNFEIIVVDNNSVDNTAKVAESFGARVIKEERKGVSFARQAGCEAAKGEIIAITDADTRVPENWLERIVKELADEKTAAFGGLYRLYSGPITAQAFIHYFAGWMWKRDYKISGAWGLPGANMAVRKPAFLKVGGFNTSLKINEDADLSKRLTTAGEVKFDPHFYVSTSGRRYRKGLLTGLSAYLPSITKKLLTKKYSGGKLATIRNDAPSPVTALLPLFLSALFLLILFSYYNPPLARAKTRMNTRRQNLLRLSKAYTHVLLSDYKNIHYPRSSSPIKDYIWNKLDRD